MFVDEKKISVLIANLLILGVVSANEGSSHWREKVPTDGKPLTVPSNTETYSSRTLIHNVGGEHGITLRGVDSTEQFEFGVRKDALVDAAALHLEYTFSPALLPQISHLSISLNEQIIQTVTLSTSDLGKPQTLEIPIDPRYFADYNRLVMRFVGHYTLDCENPYHSSLWAQVSNKSRLVLKVNQLRLANNLAQLPLPFFDPRDNSKVHAHFVLPASPSTGVLKAAGVMAGWLGAQADFRKTHIASLSESLPEGHGIVFATASQHPYFLKTIASEIKQATLQLIEHPENNAYQLLLVMGQDEAQLEMAAQALALGKVALTGARTQIQALEPPQKRQAYDAPRWHNIQEPIKLSELVSSSQELQVKGYALHNPIKTYLRVAPDLFTWNEKHIPVKLLYRYTPNAASGDGRVEVMLNHNLVQSLPLENVTQSQRRFLPKFGYENDQKTYKFYAPAEWLTPNNQIDFLVKLPAQELGSCFSQVPVEVRAEIDPNSTLDLSGLPHFIEMPNLKAYAQGGFPFSRLADLSETSIVLPMHINTAITDAYLNAIAHISGITGYPGTRFNLINEEKAEYIKDSDILIISDGQPSDLLERWKVQLPALLASSSQSIYLTQESKNKLSDLWKMRNSKKNGSGNATLITDGNLAAIAGFQSPIQNGRSVIALMSNNPKALELIEKNINDNSKVSKFMGDLSIINDKEVQSFRVQPTYFVGKLSLIEGLWFKLHESPIALAFLGCLIGMIFTFFIYASLRFMARRRLEQAT